MGTIVVGVDASDTAHEAATVAARLAMQLDARLHIVTAYEKGATMHVPGGPAITQIERAESLLAALASEFRSRVGEVTIGVSTGKPADVICAEATSQEADLIVVGNKRMHGASRILGAVAERVLRHAPCDVYVANTT